MKASAEVVQTIIDEAWKIPEFQGVIKHSIELSLL